MLSKELFDLLDEAVDIVSQFSGGYSNQFIGAEEFHAALSLAVAELKAGNYSRIDDLWSWFAPTCSWDDFIGRPGEQLANKIFEQLDMFHKQR